MNGKKVLVVDDSSTVLMMQRMVLSKHAYEVVTAANGEDAIQVAVREKPDLILMDVIMPKMDGFEACRRIRQEPDVQNVPIIMVTTRGEALNMEKGYESGCNDYVTKPINPAELLTKVRDYVKG